MTLDFTMLLKPLVVLPVAGVLLLGTAILFDRIRRRHLHAHES